MTEQQVDRSEPRIFGYAMIDGRETRVHVSELVPAAQLGFVLGKLLPAEAELWISPTEVREADREHYVPISMSWDDIEALESTPDQQANLLPARSKGWFPALKNLILEYYRRNTPDRLEDIIATMEVLMDEPAEQASN